MKNFVVVLFVLAAISFAGCNKTYEMVDYGYEGVWTYINETPYEIEMNGYFSDYAFQKTVNILSGKSQVLRSFYMGGKDPDARHLPLPFVPEEFTVVYDGKVSETFKWDESLFDRDQYEFKKVKEDDTYKYCFSYKFTEADYQRAIEKAEGN